MSKAQVAIIGSGNIGTDLLLKMLHTSEVLEPAVLVGIDPSSDGLEQARGLGVATTHEGIEGLGRHPKMQDIVMLFDSSSAKAHATHDAFAKRYTIPIVDLTPAAMGPYVIPVVNANTHLDKPNVSMVTCGGQATIPMVAAVRRVAQKIPYAEIVSSVASRSAGPGTRANIDEFTRTTARAIEAIGGADRGKAVIILNPAEPPLLMRNSIFTLSQGAKQEEIEASVQEMVKAVAEYVPGYHLKQEIQFEPFGANHPLKIPGYGTFDGLKTSIFLEVEGAGHYLPSYAGNLDIMTSAALATGEGIIKARYSQTTKAQA